MGWVGGWDGVAYLSDDSDLSLVSSATTLHQGDISSQTQSVHVTTSS